MEFLARGENFACGREKAYSRLRRFATLLPLALFGAQQAVAERPWKAKVIEPIPFATRPAGGHEQQAAYEERFAKARKRDAELTAIEAILDEQEANFSAVLANQRDWERYIEHRRDGIQCEKDQWLQSWAAQETALLHLTVFRLVRIQAAAFGAFEKYDESVAEAHSAHHVVRDGSSSPPHERWSRVEIVTCIPGKLNVVAGDFPVHMILRATTPFTLRNICEEKDDLSISDMAATLRALMVFLNYAVDNMMGPVPVLIYIVLGTNIFFNEFLDSGFDGAAKESRAARHVMARYEAAIADTTHPTSDRPVVVATDVLCYGCTEEEAMLHFLRPGGLAGSAEGLALVVHEILSVAEDTNKDGRVNPAHGLRQLLLRPDMLGWLVPDRKQRLFGSFAEAVPGPCPDGSRSQTTFCTDSAFTAASASVSEDRYPCCPVGADLHSLHEAYYPRYSVQGCAMRRFGDMPVSFHGDGPGKWPYILALHDLASNCRRVARLVLHNHPVDMLDHVFKLFSDTQQPGAAQPIAF
mmetsp:Transcript_73155/g.114522  ORF Transcript_73155/g.114522 Transcript_73155/m.114522 type:complete len:525 (+) Transcript_73155:37-1611(+)